MKRLLVVTLLLAFGLLTLAKTTITVWTLFSGGEGFLVTELINRFNAEHPDIEVVEQIVEWGQFYNKLTTAVAAGDPPDVSVMHLVLVPDYASRGALTPLDKYISKEILQDYVPEILEKAYYDGKLYALPFDTHPIVLYYNKKLLKQAGLVDANGEVLLPKTWDELLSYAKQAKEKLGLEVGISSEIGAMMGDRLFTTYYAQLGGQFYDEKTKTVKLDPDKVKKTYEFMRSLYTSGIMKPMDYPTAESLFQNNQSPFHINGVWVMALYPTLEGLEFGVTRLPTIPGSKPYTWAGSHTWVIPKKPKDDPAKIAAAAKFIEWFAKNAAEWAKAGHLPVLKSVLNSEAFLGLPMRKDYANVAEYLVSSPNVKGWLEVMQKMFEIGEAVILGKMTPDEATKELVNFVKQVVED